MTNQLCAGVLKTKNNVACKCVGKFFHTLTEQYFCGTHLQKKDRAPEPENTC